MFTLNVTQVIVLNVVHTFLLQAVLPTAQQSVCVIVPHATMAVPVPNTVTITTAPVRRVSQVSEIALVYHLLPFICVTFPAISETSLFVGSSDILSSKV
jgi:hypothetical protein